MHIIHTIAELRSLIAAQRKNGASVGFVPTMGYLHAGHMELVRHARENNDFTVVSVFLNPLQFGANEDLSKYPRDLERDASLLSAGGVDVLFAPAVAEIYPQPMQTVVDVPTLGAQLEGEVRPGHFAGVTTVVAKLFNIVQPDHAYFGEKDFQQVVIIKRMVEDLLIPVEVVAVPTVREVDGLAYSSRNSYLSEAERQAAIIVPQALQLAEKLIAEGKLDAAGLEQTLTDFIKAEPLAVPEVVAVRNPHTLERVSSLDGAELLVALFVRVGTTKLLDNRVFKRS
ncbi:pantoate--beta-alanine ligase [Paenochrobactrum gallinarii]|uniref:Pantothenate synthetase n=1 Tax=Paenochrobactrum gallinarii TaxID=643673 RepID=A0A841LTP6_9HYPH|nr:pantoate--beta-alanine ligase [Paenochrobactrum gallinarii]MBB6260636.1 pantoate--beta-alanine ligase [Paenochrobactrum gallinarii]